MGFQQKDNDINNENNPGLDMVWDVLLHTNSTHVPTCSSAFNESTMFSSTHQYEECPDIQKQSLYDLYTYDLNSGVFADSTMDQDSKILLNHLRDEFLLKFRNISMIMDCVGCEKCKLWGKIQTLGLGTAIKILLADEQNRVNNINISFSRNEIIALIYIF